VVRIDKGAVFILRKKRIPFVVAYPIKHNLLHVRGKTLKHPTIFFVKQAKLVHVGASLQNHCQLDKAFIDSRLRQLWLPKTMCRDYVKSKLHP
jgi:hypothetical protein